MKKKFNLYFILSGLFFLLFILFTIMIKGVDVRPVGPRKSMIGFATINTAIHSALGESQLFYSISEHIGNFCFVLIGLFALIGLIQLVSRKSIAKVDHDILILGGFFVLVLICYVLFDLIAINYRPVLENGSLEPSYPSSHVMMILCVIIPSMLQFAHRIHTSGTKIIINTVCTIIMIAGVTARLLSGVHWFTDIIGSVLISVSFIFLYSACIHLDRRKAQKYNSRRLNRHTY